MARRKLWAITNGCYSDYRVIALFDSEEQAEAVRKEFDMGDAVEEFPYYEAGEEPRRVDYFRAFVQVGQRIEAVDAKAETWTEGKYSPWWDNDDEPPPARPVVRERRLGVNGPMEIAAMSTDRDAAIKAVADRLASHLAHPHTAANPAAKEA